MSKMKVLINGVEKVCEILYTFKSENTKKSYLICTDNTFTNGELNVYSFIYYPNEKEKGIIKIEEKEDLDAIETFISLLEVNCNE